MLSATHISISSISLSPLALALSQGIIRPPSLRLSFSRHRHRDLSHSGGAAKRRPSRLGRGPSAGAGAGAGVGFGLRYLVERPLWRTNRTRSRIFHSTSTSPSSHSHSRSNFETLVPHWMWYKKDGSPRSKRKGVFYTLTFLSSTTLILTLSLIKSLFKTTSALSKSELSIRQIDLEEYSAVHWDDYEDTLGYFARILIIILILLEVEAEAEAEERRGLRVRHDTTVFFLLNFDSMIGDWARTRTRTMGGNPETGSVKVNSDSSAAASESAENVEAIIKKSKKDIHNILKKACRDVHEILLKEKSDSDSDSVPVGLLICVVMMEARSRCVDEIIGCYEGVEVEVMDGDGDGDGVGGIHGGYEVVG